VSVRLIALKCPRCERPLRPAPSEVAFACGECGQVVRVAGDAIAPQIAHWAAARPGASVRDWLPFWTLPGEVRFSRRKTDGFQLAQLVGGTGADPLWERARRLWVPAFRLELDEAQRWGARLTREAREYTHGPMPDGAPLRGCELDLDDARRLAEFIVLSIEAERSDTLADLEFTLPDGEPELWLLPWDGDQLIAA
jgi:hypothetical protein